MATHSSVLAWRIPGAGEPGGLTSMGSHRVGHDWSDLAAAVRLEKPFTVMCGWCAFAEKKALRKILLIKIYLVPHMTVFLKCKKAFQILSFLLSMGNWCCLGGLQYQNYVCFNHAVILHLKQQIHKTYHSDQDMRKQLVKNEKWTEMRLAPFGFPYYNSWE